MNALLINPSSPKLLAESAGPGALLEELAETVRRSAEWAEFSFEAIRIRAETVTPILEEALHAHLPVHWGINE